MLLTEVVVDQLDSKTNSQPPDSFRSAPIPAI